MNLGLAAVAALSASARPAAAQCAPEWVPAFPQGDLGFDNNMNHRAYALTVFDADGAGPGLPSLCAAGDFRTAGGVVANGIALWNGSSWSGLGGGMDNMDSSSYPDVRALASFDEDGPGPNPPRLVAAGIFSSMGGSVAYGLARWDGLGWSPIAGASGQGVAGGQPYSTANALAVFDDDGAGPHPEALYVGGNFTSVGGVASSFIARWDGTSWSAVGGGMDRPVRSLFVFDDDGNGPHPPSLYAGGEFTLAGGTGALHIARWDGSSWSALGNGVPSFVISMTAWDSDGTGPLPTSLYVGGETTGGEDNLFRWGGSTWFSLGFANGYDDRVDALLGFDGDGSSPPRLFAGGEFIEVNGVTAIGMAQWDGASWSRCGTGVHWPGGGINGEGQVFALAAFDDDGPGPHPSSVFADGSFTQAGSINADAIAAWDGANWTSLGTGIGGGRTTVGCLTVHDEDGSGPKPSALFAGGDFGIAGQVGRNLARWDGATWSTVGGGTDRFINCMSVFDEDGAGPAPARLFVGGGFTSAGGVDAYRIARWDGSTFSPVVGGGGGVGGDGPYGSVGALVVFDEDGAGPGSPALIVGGDFTTAGGAGAAHIARWDGSAWSPLGSGLSAEVSVLAVYDVDGTGPDAAALYAGGSFTASGSASVNYVARWDGTSWTQVGMGTNGPVFAMTVYDPDGAGPLRPRLVVGGTCYVIGGFVTRVGGWDGWNWSPIAVGVAGPVHGMTVFDEDGTGPALPALFVGGQFPGTIARWDGSSSSPGGGITGVGPSNNAYVSALTTFDEDGSGPAPGALYVGGRFDHAGSVASAGIARWNGCGSLVTSFCADAGCPCGNDGAPRRGCQNSAGTGGTLLTASGNAGVTDDTFVLHTSGELPVALSVVLQGNAQIGPVVFGDGLRCVGGSLKRLYTKNASGGSVTAPSGGDSSVSRRSGERGDGLHAGAARYYQVYYRDPSASFCPSPQGNTWNVSNALAVSWNP